MTSESPMERFLPISYLDLTLDSILSLSKRIFSNVRVYLLNGFNTIPGTKILLKDVFSTKCFKFY